jgi:transcriptional regulator with XRE-family HTH domain
MAMLKNIREKQNLTQEELSDRSGISVRTIQRIEAGTNPKGHTLKILAKTLAIEEKELLGQKSENPEEEVRPTINEKPLLLNYSLIKLINLSSLLFAIIPPLNILIPLIIIAITKQKNPITKQIVSVQIMWTTIALIVFMLVIFMKLGNKVALITMILIALSNVSVILRNVIEIDKRNKLYFKLNFNMI